jgi:hypothetical protein
MTEGMTRIVYRLTWESINTWQAAGMEQSYGKDVWPSLPDEKWASLAWQEPTVKVADNPWDQYHTLKRWAATHEQPIRNVRLEKRQEPVPDAGWERVDA